MRFQQVTIVGTGLIGGSLGLACKQHGVAQRVVGCDRAEVLEQAQRLGAIDGGETELAPACAGSDLIVLAVPVGGIIDCIGRLADVSGGALVTDVGSTKREICGASVKIWGDDAGERFLPGHPMAGTAEGGITNATAELFRGAPWLFTPLRRPLPQNASTFIGAVESMGARPLECDAADHDRICAYASHLPQLLATALANVVDEADATALPVGQLAGPGLRTMTRLAASPYSMWRDITLTNADNIADAILKMEQKLAHLRENLKSPELRAEFERAQAARSMLK